MSPVRELTAPARRRGKRKPKYPFSKAEVAKAKEMLDKGKSPGVGPYEGESASKEARSAIQSLVRHIRDAFPDVGPIGTRAWESEENEGEWLALCYSKSE